MNLNSNAFETFIDGYFDGLEQTAEKFKTSDYGIGVLKGIITAKIICKNAIADADDDFVKSIFFIKNRLQKILLDTPATDAFSRGLRYSVQLIINNFDNLSQILTKDGVSYAS